nr:putative ribonuclease H-like domain-containing protein [Tanacetum cinerariifolium]
MCDKKNNVLFTNTACVVLSPDFKLTDKSHVLLKVSRKNNMYSVDLKNIVPQGGLTCLFAKATSDESNLWHKRLEHVNFKTINKLIKENLVRGKTKVETVPDKDYILLPLWTQDPPFSSSLKDSLGAGFKPSGEEEKKDAEDLGNEYSKVPSIEKPRVNQEKDANVNSTNNINTISPTDNAAGIEDNVVDENIVYGCVDDPNIPDLEEINRFSNAEDDDLGTDMNNLDTYFQVSLVPTTRIHKDHPFNQVIGDLQSATQTRQMTKNLEEYGFFSTTLKQRTSHKDLQNFLFACFLSQEEPKKEVYVCQPPGFEDPDFPDRVYKVEKMDVKSAFLYVEIKEEVYICQPPSFEDPDFPNRVYKIEKALYGLLQVPRACDYAGESLDRKSTIECCQFLGCRLILWQCKNQTVVANSTTEAEYVAALSCCSEVLWIQNQLLDHGYNFMHTKIYINNESTICMVKNPVFHSKTKHIEIRHHFIRDSNENKLIQMIKIHTDKNVADLLTKAFDKKSVNEEEQLQALVDRKKNKVFNLENTKTAQAQEIDSLKKRVKKLERRHKSKNLGLKRLYKGRFDDQEMFDTWVLDDEEVVVEKAVADKEVSAIEEVNVASIVTYVTTTTTTSTTTSTISMVEITLAKALIEIKTSRPKAKGIVIKEPSKTPTPTPIVSSQQPSKVQDK